MLESIRRLDQLKRLRGALQSKNPAAYLGIFLKALGPFTRLLDEMIFSFAKIPVPDVRKMSACLMIVSPPRSGSTIIYQTLIRTIPSVYMSNLHSLFPHNASSYMRQKDRFGRNLSRCQSYYGYSSSLFDVNEGNEVIEELIKDNAQQEMIRKRFAKFFTLMQPTSDMPLIFKNVRAYPNLVRLKKAIPELIFLRIKRNIEAVVQSVVSAYHELGTFHPIPETLKDSNIRDPLEFAVRQIVEIERTLDEQRDKIGPTNWIEWYYEDFCADPWPMIESLSEKHLNINLSCLRRNALPALHTSRRTKVNSQEAKRISLLLRRYVTEAH